MRARRFAMGVAAALLAAFVAVPAAMVTSAPALATAARGAGVHASAAGPPVMIGVDHAPPPGKNWGYTHYFPETGVNVPQGGLVLFSWDAGQNNGLHSVTFVPAGSTVAAQRQTRPTVVKDADNGESDVVIPAITNNGTSATCSTGPTAPPCSFDGTAVVSSGIIPASSGAKFAVQIASTTAPGTYTYFCVLHPAMQGSLTVVPAAQPATDPATVASMAANELNTLNAGAAAAEAAASVPTFTTNANGTRSWTQHVGLSADDVELFEFLPVALPIVKGDSVKFDASGTTQEIHTVTSIAGGGGPTTPPLLPFLPNQCESATGSDTPAQRVQGPPQTGCADPNGFEQGFNLGVQGEPNVISVGDRTAASAFISGRTDAQALGAPASHTYSFPNNGSYGFFCFLHTGMFGAVETPGYRLGANDGGTFNFGGSDFVGSNPSATGTVVATPSTFDRQGDWTVTADGHTANFGSALSVGNIGVHNGSPIVGAAPTSDNGGLWLVAKDGRVYPLGDAQFAGDLGGVKLAAPIVGIASDGSSGYLLVAADGGVFAFAFPAGNGPPGSNFLGSLGGVHLNAPIVGMAVTADGQGYFLFAGDGGVFTFGSAQFKGSLGGVRLAAPIVAMAPTLDGGGYRMAAADGGVFDFGDAKFFGSAASYHIHGAVVGIG